MEAPTPWRRPEPLPGFLETERLVLRWWEAGDAQGVHEAVTEDRGALLPWMPWAASDHKDAEESAERIAWFTGLRAKDADFTLGAFDRATGEVIGGSGFHRMVPAAHEAETGYWIRGSRQREGLATEMARAMLSWGFSAWGFRRIHLMCAGGNAGSIGVIEKLGVPFEGRRVQARFVEGVGWSDDMLYGVLAPQWDCEQHRMRATE